MIEYMKEKSKKKSKEKYAEQANFNDPESGQALTEYVILLSMVLWLFLMASSWISRLGLDRKMASMVTGPFAAAYTYGHTQAKGLDDGGPTNHPRIDGGDGNFRIFYNPATR